MPSPAETVFFKQKAVKDAIRELLAAEELVIYCGAGVSIDRTNVGWAELVRRVYGFEAGGRAMASERRGLRHLLEDPSLPPEQMASLVIEALSEDEPEEALLGSKLKEILYLQNGWNAGLMLRNLIQFALVAGATKPITIITTNYDTHIESAFRAARDWLALEAEKGDVEGPIVLPGLAVFTSEVLDEAIVQGPDVARGTEGGELEGAPEKERPPLPDIAGRPLPAEWKREDLIPDDGAGMVRLVYLHGRVDPSAKVEGNLVLSERSYAKTRDRSQRLLLSQFGPEPDAVDGAIRRGVLIVGASLTDQPLIHSLALSRPTPRELYPPAHRRSVKLPREVRYALLSVQHAEGVDRQDLESAHGLRGRHLGLQVLFPMAHFQSAQFLEELRVGMVAVGQRKTTSKASDAAQPPAGFPGAESPSGSDEAEADEDGQPTAAAGMHTVVVSDYTNPRLGIAYQHRLDSWWRGWELTDAFTDADYVHRELTLGLKVLMKHHLDGKAPAGELLRLELWARRDPRSKKRLLTLWGSSAGPMKDDLVRREESLVPPSTNASVQAFLAGRPQLRSLGELGHVDRSSRWKTFLSVPIFVQVRVDDLLAGAVPVGVVTLASTKQLETTDPALRSVLAEGLSNAEKTVVKERMIGIGQRLLTPRELR